MLVNTVQAMKDAVGSNIQEIVLAKELGFIGLGTMGHPIAARLLEKGTRVRAYDSNQDRALSLRQQGAKIANSITELASESELVFLSLPHPQTVAEVVSRLLADARQGLVIVDMSTIGPSLARHLNDQARTRGVYFVDAPVSGGPSRAKTGELSIMVGGDDAAVREVWDFLSIVGKHVVHTGSSGNGSLCKLLNNFAATWNMIGVSQAFIMATEFGLPLEQLYAVMARSSGQSYSLERNYPKIGKEDFSPGFSLELGKKDMFLALDLAQEAGLHLIAENDIRGIFDSLIAHGCSQRDLAYIHKGIEAALATQRGLG